MRPRIYVPVIVLVTIPILYFATRVYFFIHLFKQHSGIAISQAEVAIAYNTTKDVNDHEYTQRIPKIIHHIWHVWNVGDDADNQAMPGDWSIMRDGCKELNPGWEFKLWTTKSSGEFIAGSYPWFLNTYDGYKYPVQRVDTVRYFLMRHYGGIYMDLDNGCNANLNPTLYYPAFLMDGGRGVLNNNILGAAPNHPFWELLTDSLISYNYDYLFPFITVSWASGQWFETSVWEQYHSLVRRIAKGEKGVSEAVTEYQKKNDIKDMKLFLMGMDERDGRYEEWVFFSEGRGGTWVQWDLAMFVWLGGHWKALIFLVCMAIGGIVLRCVRFWGKRS
ncbi:hypothetical protein HYFRA_00006537 [Hymenoscyphus fraxineus]|uniref:Glycosyltransferase family 32 protein n=1 Tax=Hymenoscyphus fraxineus TaxID=746836 RepID=A0A9N9PG19_9HELO|nr:hypothetical protein HYFRA_00006537 [Hymenoscyphus fraxineus]